MFQAQQLDHYLHGQYGGAKNLLVQDATLPSGLRVWDDTDSESLVDWLNSMSAVSEENLAILCYNINQAAKAVGVGPHTIQAWLSRETDPLPHTKTDRRKVIPHFMLMEWLREECIRTISREPQH